jgi:flagella basal body P-ring formation protein FlgA
MKKLPFYGGGHLPLKAFAAVLIAGIFFLMPVLAGAASSVHDAVREYIETHMPWPQGTARLAFATSEPALSAGRHEITFRIEAAGAADFIGDAAFIARIYAGGKYLRTETVRTQIEVLRDVVVAAKAIYSGSVLKEDDVRLVKKWLRRNMPDALSGIDEAVGKRITLQVRPGVEISARMLKETPLVRKGQAVRVLFDNDSLQISTVGIPEEDGVAGNMIRIKNMTSNKIIYARVLGASLVGVGI